MPRNPKRASSPSDTAVRPTGLNFRMQDKSVGDPFVRWRS
jgi:hypothetical protein